MTVKQALLKLAAGAGLAAAARKATARHLRILCYHGLWVTPGPDFGDCTFISPAQFEARMTRLKRSGRPVLPLGEAVARLAAGTLPEAAVVITIDDGWVSTLTHMLPVLESLRLPATLYATTWYSGRDLPVVNLAVDYLVAASGRRGIDPGAAAASIESLPTGQRLAALRAFGAAIGVDETWLELRQFHIMSPAELAEAARRGLDIQLHSHRHIDVGRRVASLSDEIEENRASLACAVPRRDLVHFCYPSGTFHPRAPALLAASGIASATLVTEGLNAPAAHPYALRRFLDGRRVSDVEFDAYLSGLLHYLASLRALRLPNFRAAPRRAGKRSVSIA